jgi:hypothetical protein
MPGEAGRRGFASRARSWAGPERATGAGILRNLLELGWGAVEEAVRRPAAAVLAARRAAAAGFACSGAGLAAVWARLFQSLQRIERLLVDLTSFGLSLGLAF